MSLKIGDLVEVTNQDYNTCGSIGPIVDIDPSASRAPFRVRIAGVERRFNADDIGAIPDGLRAIATTPDSVEHPPHYVNHPSGIECIQVTEHMGFNLGNAVKYIWRCDLKQDAIEDLKKARWYLDREIAKREAAA